MKKISPSHGWWWQEIGQGVLGWASDPPPSSPNMDLYLVFLRWTFGRCIVQLLTYRNCLFPRLEPRLISELFTTSQLSDRKACYPAALGLYLFLSLPPIYLCSSRECCQVPSWWGRHCKSLIPKLILQQGTSSGQPSHSANTTRIFFFSSSSVFYILQASLSKS